MGKAMTRAEDYTKLTEKHIYGVIKNLQQFEKKFPDKFKKFLKEPYIGRSLKTIYSYLE